MVWKSSIESFRERAQRINNFYSRFRKIVTARNPLEGSFNCLYLSIFSPKPDKLAQGVQNNQKPEDRPARRSAKRDGDVWTGYTHDQWCDDTFWQTKGEGGVVLLHETIPVAEGGRWGKPQRPRGCRPAVKEGRQTGGEITAQNRG